MKTVIFTDIDGTFIDHHTYSITTAKKAYKLLRRGNIPLILCSSKTYDEQIYLQTKIGINHPFIIENGSAIIIPHNYFNKIPATAIHVSNEFYRIQLAKHNIAYIRNSIQQVNYVFECEWQGYFSLNNKQIANYTQLKGKGIARAKNRWFTETLLNGQITTPVLEYIENLNLTVSKGGRFFTLQDKYVNKGAAIRALVSLFSEFWGLKPHTIGVGDSLNDLELLNSVDRPFLVKQHTDNWADINLPFLTKIDAIGPRGFILLIEKILHL